MIGSMKNTDALTIGAESDGGVPFTGSLAWVMILKEKVNTAWASNYNNGHFDFSGGNLILYVPFIDEETVFGEATTPFCVSS